MDILVAFCRLESEMSTGGPVLQPLPRKLLPHPLHLPHHHRDARAVIVLDEYDDTRLFEFFALLTYSTASSGPIMR